MKKSLLFTLGLLIAMCIHSQQVVTLVTSPVIHDGLYVDSDGNVFTTSGGLTGSDHIGKYNVETETFEPQFANGFAGPINIASYRDSLLLVTNYDNNTVYSYNLNTGEVNTIATGLDGPAGIAVDDEDNIYITNWGQAPAWLGTEIHKIDANGNLSVLTDDSLLVNPQAIAINQLGEIIVHSSAWLYKVDSETGAITPWTFLGITVPNIVFRNADNGIYGVGDDKVLKVDENGILSIISGGESGYQDGTLEEARYTDAIGVGFSPDEQTLYVSESAYQTGMGRLRALNLDGTTGIPQAAQSTIEIKVYPTVVSHSLNIALAEESPAFLQVFTLSGKKVMERSLSSSNQIECSQLSSGPYVVRVQTQSGVGMGRFVKD